VNPFAWDAGVIAASSLAVHLIERDAVECHRGTIDENEEFSHKYDWNGHLFCI
jgi:hypothetical protein